MQKTALLSVSHKRGLVEFALGLEALGYRIVSTGNSLKQLHEGGVQAIGVDSVTGFPEMLGGRVKTLHPNVHGGILARDTPEHLAELAAHGIDTIDVVAVNLYPFRETVRDPLVTSEMAMENVDIGGPTMVRAAAKNHERVTVVVDPNDYDSVLADLQAGGTAEFRRAMAVKAFAHTAAYDAAIVAWFEREEALPEYVNIALERADVLRYGENPHQPGARYREVANTGMWDEMVQHSGTALSYLNLFDAEAAWRLAHELGENRAAVVVKHANPSGAAVAGSVAEAYAAAYAADPKSAFGGIIALPGIVDSSLAEDLLSNAKADVVLAHSYTDGALELLTSKRTSSRILGLPAPRHNAPELRRLDGGFLLQQPDLMQTDRQDTWKVVTNRQPTEAEWRDLLVAETVCARTWSNAIVLVHNGVAVGVGAGQQSRVDAANIATTKAAGRAAGGAAASDAFFPFRDGLEAVAASGITAVVQPGGSVKDEEIIEAANELGLAMVFTGTRRFRH